MMVEKPRLQKSLILQLNPTIIMSKMNDNQVGYTDNVYKVEKVGSHYRMFDVDGEDQGTLGVNTTTRKKAYNNQTALREYVGKTGKTQFRQVPMEEFKSKVIPLNNNLEENEHVESPESLEDIRNFIHNESPSLRPDNLMMKDLKWKYLVRSALRAKNIMMTGPAGCGKTMAAFALMKGLGRPGFTFNLGSTQDARATLIGNTHFDNDQGTFFAKSSFIEAITTPNSIILLDELSRAHPDAWNILMPVLDNEQRYLRLDEAEGSPTVEVAKGVTFIATANIGNEYTATRVMDRAIRDRFTTIEMDLLDENEEFKLLRMLYPDVNDELLAAVSEIANHTRQIVKADTGQITSMISTRTSVEMSGLLMDGFSLVESAEISIFPHYSEDGGDESERTYIKQLVQKYVPSETSNDEELFGTPEEETNDKDDFPW